MNNKIKAFAEKQMEIANSSGMDTSKMVGFEYKGTYIINPFVDETCRFEVDPYEYYGMQAMIEYTNGIIEKATQRQELYYAFADYYDDLDYLTRRLQDDYNNGEEFEQQEQDRLGLCYLLDLFDSMEVNENEKSIISN